MYNILMVSSLFFFHLNYLKVYLINEETFWTFPLYINIDNDHRVCHYFDRRPFGHDQGH